MWRRSDGDHAAGIAYVGGDDHNGGNVRDGVVA